MRKLLRAITNPWVFILLGVSLTVFSAILTNITLAEKKADIQALRLQVQDIEKQIREHWEVTKSLEYEEHTGTIILLFSELTQSLNQADSNTSLAINRFLEQVILAGYVPPEVAAKLKEDAASRKNPRAVLTSVFDIVDNHRHQTIEKINELYITQQNLLARIGTITEQEASLTRIALFLQILGLLFVLLKDMGRTTTVREAATF